MEKQQKEREQKMSKKSGGSDSLWESEAASLAMGAADVNGLREIVPATAKSTLATQSNISSVTTLAPRHTSSTPPSNSFQYVPAATATPEPEKGSEAREKTLKERKETDLASPPHPPHQTTAHGSATSSADLDDPVVFQARTPEEKIKNDRAFGFAVTRLRPTETVVPTVYLKKTVLAKAPLAHEIQSRDGSVTTPATQHRSQSPPSNKSQRVEKERKVLTEQEEKELVDEIQASFTALEIASVLDSSFNVLGWQPPKKKLPDVATVDSNRRSPLNSGIPTASDFAFQAKPMPEFKIAAIPSSFNIGPSRWQLPTKLTPLTVPKIQSNVGSVPTAANLAFRATPLPELKIVANPSSLNYGLLIMQAPSQDVALGVSEDADGLVSAMSKMTSEQKSVMSVLASDSGKTAPCTMTPKQRSVTHVATGDSSTAGRTILTPMSRINRNNAPAYKVKPRGPASHRTQAATNSIPAAKSLSTKADPIHLFTLPQELQDAIFEFAYTEPSFKAINKGLWDVRQDCLRKSTGTPRVAFPPPKVAEWIVSKRYFRSAAKAWVGAQTSLERIQNREPSDSAFELFESFHPFVGMNSGLFYEFATAFQLAMPRYCRPHYSERILQCSRMRHLICLVDEEFLGECDRGFAWEVEFTDAELMGSLVRVNFKLPWRVETVQVQPDEGLVYTDTDAKKAVLVANLANLQRMMCQRKLKKPRVGTAEAENCSDTRVLYVDSKVTCAPSLPMRLPGPIDKDKKRELHGDGTGAPHLRHLLSRSKGRKRPECFDSDLLTRRATKRVAANS